MKRLLIASALCASCAVGPDYERPQVALPDAYRTGFEAQGTDDAWWTGFRDEQLNLLVDRALAGNLTIAAAQARLDRARAFIRAERADLLPTIDGQLGGNAVRGAASEADVGLNGFWFLDVFGGRRREVAAALASADASAAGLADARRITAASLAAAYVELRRTDARIALLDQSLELQQQTLRIVRLRAETGLAADLDVQRAAADLAQTRAQRGPLAAARADADYTISLLSGVAPGTEVIPVRETPVVPTYSRGPEVGIPAALLRARPDVRAAEAQLIAATERVGAEVADLYPALNLTGVISTRIDSSSFADQTAARAGAVLDVPLLDFGRRRAEVRAARADADAALAAYRLALLTALQDVESALVAINAAEAQRDDLEEAVNASAISFDQLQALYTEGLATLIDVLDAQRQLIASRERFTDSEARLAQAYVSLYAALGASAES